MQMYDNVLTKSIHLTSLSNDKAANQYLQLIISLFIFFFSLGGAFFFLINVISVHPPLSQLFLHSGALHISVVSYLLPCSCPVQSLISVFPQSYSISSFLLLFHSDFLQASVCQASALGGFSFSSTLKEKPKLPLHSSIWYQPASDQL